jgi:hypothetical protein
VRKLALLLTICFVLPVCLPHDASAQNVWKVKNAAGKVIGTVRKASGKRFTVRSRDGVPHGQIIPNPGLPSMQWDVGMYLPSDGGVRKIAHVCIGTKYVPWYTLASETVDSRIGRVIKRKQRWVVQWDLSDDFSKWRTRGYVAANCKPWAALGAVWILDNKWP